MQSHHQLGHFLVLTIVDYLTPLTESLVDTFFEFQQLNLIPFLHIHWLVLRHQS